MTVEEWLGEENQLGTDIWTKKYCNEGESGCTGSAAAMKISQNISARRSSCLADVSFLTEDWIRKAER